MKYIIIMGLFLFFQSCNNPKFERKDFVGIWKSEDNATVKLGEDGSAIIEKINLSNIFFSNEEQVIDFTGEWKFTTDMYKEKVVKINSKKYTFDFFISGQGIFGNMPPLDLYVFIGDPDDMIKYKFVKQ